MAMVVIARVRGTVPVRDPAKTRLLVPRGASEPTFPGNCTQSCKCSSPGVRAADAIVQFVSDLEPTTSQPNTFNLRSRQ